MTNYADQAPSATALDQISKLSEVVYGEAGDAFKEHGKPQTRQEASELLKELHRIRRTGPTTTTPEKRSPGPEEDTMPDEETKYCPDCDEEKPVSEFGPNKSAKDGLQNYCRAHTRERQRLSYERRKKKKKKGTKNSNPKKRDKASAKNEQKVKASVAKNSEPDPEPDPPLSPEPQNGDLRSIFADPRASQLLDLQELIETNFDYVPSLEQVIAFSKDLAIFGSKDGGE